jgi:hypothetical protein
LDIACLVIGHFFNKLTAKIVHSTNAPQRPYSP